MFSQMFLGDPNNMNPPVKLCHSVTVDSGLQMVCVSVAKRCQLYVTLIYHHLLSVGDNR